MEDMQSVIGTVICCFQDCFQPSEFFINAMLQKSEHTPCFVIQMISEQIELQAYISFPMFCKPCKLSSNLQTIFYTTLQCCKVSTQKLSVKLQTKTMPRKRECMYDSLKEGTQSELSQKIEPIQSFNTLHSWLHSDSHLSNTCKECAKSLQSQPCNAAPLHESKACQPRN